jgi:hypothetical protein
MFLSGLRFYPRKLLGTLLFGSLLSVRFYAAAKPEPSFRIVAFSQDVTVPLGHGMMGGAWESKSISDPLEAHGLVLFGAEKPIVFVAVDWCEIRNQAYFRWQEVLAAAAETTPDRVMISTVHQHDAPVADLEAERILRSRSLEGSVCSIEFHEAAVQAVAAKLRESLSSARRVTHIGMGMAQVTNVASNRRYLTPDGALRFDRMSRSTDKSPVEAPEGLIDPWLRTLSFWDGDTALAAVSAYATHPMSYYGQGEVSADFPGIARRLRQKETPGVEQIYLTGAAGNITAGKYNNGSHENRAILAGRLHEAMISAWENTRRISLTNIVFRSEPVAFAARNSPGFKAKDLENKLKPGMPPFQQCLAAMGLSWVKRLKTAPPISVPCIDFGAAQWLLLPGEAYVEFQLAAQRMSADTFVLVSGYGDGATGYIPTDAHIKENDSNLADWCWVAGGSEAKLLHAIRKVLGVPERAVSTVPWKSNIPIALVKKEMYLNHTAAGVAPWASVSYTGPNLELREVRGIEQESDVGEKIQARWSLNNGVSWTDFVPVQSSNKTNYHGIPVWEGECANTYHEVSGLLVQLWLRQIQIKSIYHNFTYVRTSSDQGRTWSPPSQLRYEPGDAFDPAEPIKAGFLDHNEAYPGNNVFTRSDGDLLVCLAHANAMKDPKNDVRPWRLGSISFVGHWNKSRYEYQWHPKARVEIAPEISARGLMEPEVAELKDGRVLVVWRGSTDGWDGSHSKVPGRKFFSVSTDGLNTLSSPAEWKYDDGTSFYSPSSFHRMIRHQANGKLYWLGNISSVPPSGNSPRYPLIIAEVDEQKAFLKRSSVTTIDDRQIGQGDIQFSNFSLLEDRRTHELILHLTTFGQEPNPKDWATADNYKYFIVLRE